MTSAKDRVVIRADRFDAVIFDLDGVITDTARVHAAAWKRLFDEYLAEVAPPGTPDRPFDDDDYRRYVDGRARIDGVEGFLSSRGIELDRGTPDDPFDVPTAWGLANGKNGYFQDILASDGVVVFPSSVEAVHKIRDSGLMTGLVTASRNRAQVLAAAGITNLFDAHVDGIVAAELGLAGKPDPAPFLEAARRLGVDPSRAVVVEDALSGVEAGRRGGFGLVIGVDRFDDGEEMLEHGADVVVSDLAALSVAAEER